MRRAGPHVTCLSLAGLLVAACATAPLPVAPSPPPAALGAFVGASAAGATITAPPQSGWWRLFDDPALNGHVVRALEANVDLRVALANLEIARAGASQANAARLPATSIESGAGPTRADRQPSTASVPKTGYELAGAVSYEIDLFGRLRSAADAALADADAAEAALDTVRVAVAADTVAAWLDLCAAEANAGLAQRQVEVQQASYDVLADQLAAGEVSPLEVGQAALLRERTAAAMPTFQAARRMALFRLAVLQGRPPAEADRFDTACAAPPRIAAPLPVGDGASLIARRPDIREADRRLSAASARVGVATADLYPRLQIGASAGLIAGGIDAVLTPLATWAFPNQAAARARIAAAKGGADAALANWDRVMLRALGEVEAALADYAGEVARRRALETALVEAEAVARRSQVRRRLGADTPLVAIDAERSRNDTAVQLLASQIRVSQVQVALFRALGGGWEREAVTDRVD